MATLFTPTKTSTDRLSHLAPNERAGLSTLVQHLAQHYGTNLLHVILFGSKARGDFTPESDLDILVVMRMHEDDYRRYWNEIVQITWDVELTYGLVTSLVIKSEHDYAQMCEQQLLFARNIEQDGIELWTEGKNTDRQDKRIISAHPGDPCSMHDAVGECYVISLAG